MEELDAMLRENNPYALTYKMMRQVFEKNTFDVKLKIYLTTLSA
jgi:hypothetical protein